MNSGRGSRHKLLCWFRTVCTTVTETVKNELTVLCIDFVILRFVLLITQTPSRLKNILWAPATVSSSFLARNFFLLMPLTKKLPCKRGAYGWPLRSILVMLHLLTVVTIQNPISQNKNKTQKLNFVCDIPIVALHANNHNFAVYVRLCTGWVRKAPWLRAKTHWIKSREILL